MMDQKYLYYQKIILTHRINNSKLIEIWFLNDERQIQMCLEADFLPGLDSFIRSWPHRPRNSVEQVFSEGLLFQDHFVDKKF